MILNKGHALPFYAISLCETYLAEVMRNLYHKGENILVRWNVFDKNSAPILFSNLTDVIVVISDKQGNTRTFSKLGGTIIQGVDTNQLQFELTEAMTTGFESGALKARFTYKIPSADHASNVLTDIIEEGTTSDFINLQD